MGSLAGWFTSDIFEGGRANLSAAIAEGSKLGAVVTVGNEEAIHAAAVPGADTPLIVVDISGPHLKNVRTMVDTAVQSQNLDDWKNKLKSADYIDNDLTKLCNNIASRKGTFEALKARAEQVHCIESDIASPLTKALISLFVESIGVIYASNIQWYIGNQAFSGCNKARKPAEYREAILSLMQPNTILITGEMKVVRYANISEANSQWNFGKAAANSN